MSETKPPEVTAPAEAREPTAGGSTSACPTRFSRLVDRAFVRGLSARQRRALRDHLASCACCRERWDRLATIDRGMGGPTLTATMVDDISDAVVGPQTRRRRSVVWVIAASVVATAGVVLSLSLGRHTDRPMFTARGAAGQGRTPGVRLFCIASDTDHVRSEVAMASSGPPPALGCTIDADLQLAYSTPDREGLTMVAFGRIESSTLFYAPPAGERETVVLRANRIDEVVGWSTRLAVNHHPGRYEVIARFFDRSVSVEDAIEGRVAPVAELQAQLDVLPKGDLGAP